MPPHRFQSQSLNWLNRQRLRWNDRLQQGWRSMQMVATWGLQLVLYPLYVAVQSSRLLLHQWQRQAPTLGLGGDTGSESSALMKNEDGDRKGKSGSTPDFVALFFKALGKQFTFRPRPPVGDSLPTSSAGVTGSLATGSLVTGSLATQQSTLQTNLQPQLQGIASLRIGSSSYPAGSLVWVDDRNQIWSIPPLQQQALQYQMLTIVANHTPSPVPLKLLPERAQQLPPVRWTRRLMNWMQTSPLALATNLFQESQIQPLALPPVPFPNPLPPQFQMRVQEFSAQQSDALVRFLDYHLALIEPQNMEPQNTIVSPVPQVNPQGQALQVSPIPVSSISVSPASVSSMAASPRSVSPSPTPAIVGMTLRHRLLDTPDGHHSSDVEQSTSHPQPQTIETPGMISWDSLPSLEPLSQTILPIKLEPDSRPPVLSSPERSTFQESTVSVHKTAKFPSLKGSVKDPIEVEVKSEAIGYEKHPLEQLLHWLDRVITWIERQLAKLFE